MRAERYALGHQGAAIALAEGPGLVVGRDPDCDIALPGDTRVSRRHARFGVEGDHVFVEDLGSRNGILINGQMVVGRVRLHPGDRVAVGLEVFTVIDAQRTPLAQPVIAAPYRPHKRGRPEMLTVREETSDEVKTLVQLLIEIGSDVLVGNRLIDGRAAASAFVESVGAQAAQGALPPEVFDRGVRCFVRAAERTGDPVWLEHLFDLHRVAGRAIDGGTLFAVSRLEAIVRRGDGAALRRYLETVTPALADPAARSRMLRLQLLGAR